MLEGDGTSSKSCKITLGSFRMMTIECSGKVKRRSRLTVEAMPPETYTMKNRFTQVHPAIGTGHGILLLSFASRHIDSR